MTPNLRISSPISFSEPAPPRTVIGHAGRVSHLTDRGEIVALHATVVIDRVDDDLADAELLDLRRNFRGRAAGIHASVVRPNLVLRAALPRLDVEHDDDALVADRLGHL